MVQHEVTVPPAYTMAWPALQAIKQLGGSATVSEMTDRVATLMELSEEQQTLPHTQGSRSKFEYRLAWARTLLKKIGAVTNSDRGVWAITEPGQQMTEADVNHRRMKWEAEQRAYRLAQAEESEEPVDSPELDDHDEELVAEELNWRTTLLQQLVAMTPAGFERLSSRLLREAGFENVEVTGRSGDQGIDGTGLYRLSLVSFPVYFQCKRWQGSVGSGPVRDFRGAMAGRGDKGLLITTGTFTAEAKKEAARVGTQPIDLIDGDRLCELLREHRLGVTVTPRTVEDVEVDELFFKEI